MSQHKFRGTGVALITPFKDNQVDYPTLQRLIEFVIESGVDYIVSLGSTGEAVTLNTQECKEVLNFTKKQVNQRVPLVAGMFGHNNTQALIQRFHDFDLDGFDAVLSASPYYSKPTQEGIYQHYMAIAEVSPVPIIIYNVPSRTGSNVSAQTLVRLAKDSKKFVAVKEASGDITLGSKIIKDRPEGFLVLSGDDPTALALMACGGDGVISVIANAYPKEWSDMTRFALKGKITAAQKLNNRLFDLHHWLYCEGNPAGIKAACFLKGFGTPDVRIPLTTLSEENTSSLHHAMRQIPATSAEKKILETI